MENEQTHDDDLLKVFETETTVTTTTSNVTTASLTLGSSSVVATTDNLSNILGEINSNNYQQEDELLQILNANTAGQRASGHRRSSVSLSVVCSQLFLIGCHCCIFCSQILKVTESVAEFRRSSRRVSWAQTYQYK